MHVQNDENIDIIHSLPTEIDLCGIFKIDETKISEIEAEKIVQDILVTDNPIYLHKKLSLKHDHEIHSYNIINGQSRKIDFKRISEKEIYSEFIHLRLKTKIPLICGLNKESLSEGIAHLADNMSLGMVSFSIENSGIFIFGNSNTNVSVQSQETDIGEVFKKIKTNEENEKSTKKDVPTKQVAIVRNKNISFIFKYSGFLIRCF